MLSGYTVNYYALLFNSVGITGSFLALLTYFLLYLGKIRADNFCYPALNCLASFCILFSLFYAWNLSAFIVEACWFFISLYGMCKNYRKYR